jgi:hypothetical protein
VQQEVEAERERKQAEEEAAARALAAALEERSTRAREVALLLESQQRQLEGAQQAPRRHAVSSEAPTPLFPGFQ